MNESLKELYEFYWEIKAAVALYEVRFNKIPADLLNEIRNTFDHVARCYVLHGIASDAPNVEVVKRHLVNARGHLERLHLDLYKLFILENIDQINHFENQFRQDLVAIEERPYPLPDVTRFQVWLHKERKKVDGVITSAKIHESMQEDHDEKIEFLAKARDCQEEFIDRLHDEYGTIQPYMKEAAEIVKKDRNRHRLTTYIVPAIIAILCLIVGTILGKLF
jgi:hypothetical protein